MDANVQKALNDKLYDKRKGGALDLENLVRECLAANDHERIAKIVHQLCHDYAYAVHQPHARNGGLIGLAAASIALGPEVARYLEEIVPPVLACFSDQDARVRYYACESMYNIAKVAKGEVLLYFNEVFDALCKLAADSEPSVKNGAELLDRLVKDIVSESASSYVSILHNAENVADEDDSVKERSINAPIAFSLEKFIPLLQERIHVINPFTRTFLVSWITLLDSIPDLELVAFLPTFLAGLFRFLSDPNQDVHTATATVLEKFLSEIKRIARVKRGIAETQRSREEDGRKRSDSETMSVKTPSIASFQKGEDGTSESKAESREKEDISPKAESETSEISEDEKSTAPEEDWIPGQDVQIDYPKILDILVTFLSDSSEEEIQLTALRWIDSFFEICPEDIVPFVPRLLSHVLPALSNDVEQVRQAAHRVNNSLMEYILSLSDEPPVVEAAAAPPQAQPAKEPNPSDRRESNVSKLPRVGTAGRETPSMENRSLDIKPLPAPRTPTPAQERPETPAKQTPGIDLDYEAAVNALTLQFLNEHENTRVASLQWLIMLHKKAPRKILAINDGTFPALLKTLSDPSEAVVIRDLILLSQISKHSDDAYFTSFMVNLLKLFCTDRRLLEQRGNLIIRQLCVTLSAEKIYRTLADCLEKDEDVEFASIMVQNLNNNLITAPELADLRKRLRNLETRDGQTFFVTLFRAWCHNAVATFSLCLLAQAYEQAYYLLQIFAELEMTVNMLIQIDKLVQLLESPVFTYLRLQLLEPEKFPHLYKCLYGVLMLLPQSSAFAALKNRLNSVSAIGYLHIAPRTYVPPPTPPFLSQGQKSSGPPLSSNPTTPSSVATFERAGRLNKTKPEEGGIKWNELLEKFKSVQERARRAQRVAAGEEDAGALQDSDVKKLPEVPKPQPARPLSAQSVNRPPAAPPATNHNRAKSSLSNLGLGRFRGQETRRNEGDAGGTRRFKK